MTSSVLARGASGRRYAVYAVQYGRRQGVRGEHFLGWDGASGKRQVDTLVLTHLHYDHAGGMRTIPGARVVVQRAELAYWTGPEARRIAREAWLTDPDDIRHLARRPAGRHVDLVDGDVTVAPGLSVHHVGGHTAGLQIVRVQADAGPVVIASDASHFFENMETDRPGPILHDMPGVFRGFDRARRLAASGPVVPGHDPEVMDRFEPVSGMADRIVRVG